MGTRRWQMLLVALAASLPYLNTLHGDFCYDDKVAVGGNPDVALPDVTLYDIFTHDFWGNDILRRRKGGWTHDSWRPLVTLSFRANHKIGKLKTFAYHVTNIFVHACCCVAAYLVFLRVLIATHARHASAQAFAAGLLFGLHPVHTETVANITGRADPMAAFFCSLAVLVYIRGRDDLSARHGILWHAVHGLCSFCLVILGLMCKETSLVMPALLLVVDTAVRLQALPGAASRYGGRGVVPFTRGLLAVLPWGRSIAMVAAGALLYYVRIVRFSHGYSLKEFANEMHNPLAYIPDFLTRTRAIAFVQAWATSMLFLPVWLSHEHSAHMPVTDLKDPRNGLTLVVFGTAVGLIGLSLWTLWRVSSAAAPGQAEHSVARDGKVVGKGQAQGQAQISKPAQDKHALAGSSTLSDDDAVALGRACRVLLALGWMIVSYAPSSHAFLYVAFVIAERTLFFPSWAACLLMADGLDWLYGRDGDGDEGVPLASPAQVGTAVLNGKGKGTGPAVTAQGNKGGLMPTLTPRRTSSLALFSLLSLYYCYSTWSRGYAWQSEEALLRSNLALYPRERNGMSLYGLGAIRLYAEEWDEAHELLMDAARLTSLAEPHILLSQLEWKARRNNSQAIKHLEDIEYSSSPRKEVMQNLGLLLISTGQAPEDNEAARIRVERLILLGHAGHGYPDNHPHIGLLAMNAACIRLLSEPRRYGDPGLAITLGRQSVSFKHGSRFSALRNLVSIYAVLGMRDEALQTIVEAEDILTETLATHTATGHVDKAIMDAARIVWGQLQTLRLSIRVHGHLLYTWSVEGPATGRRAEERLQQLGTECVTELLYW